MTPTRGRGDDTNAIRGITKTGNGVLSLSARNTYKGSTTVQDGVLLMSATLRRSATIPRHIGTLNLKGGVLATTVARHLRLSKTQSSWTARRHGDGRAVQHDASLASVVMEFSSDSVVGTSGSLTISNLNNGTSNTVFRPLFTGQGFNFGLPITISVGDWNTGK